MNSPIYPYIIIDSQMNVLQVNGDELLLDFKKIDTGRIIKHDTRKELQKTISEWLNGRVY